MARALHLHAQLKYEGAAPMGTKREVIGWLVDVDAAQVLVRDEIGHISVETEDPDGGDSQWAIQTGRFRQASPIIDPLTKETLGYEMVRL